MKNQLDRKMKLGTYFGRIPMGFQALVMVTFLIADIDCRVNRIIYMKNETNRIAINENIFAKLQGVTIAGSSLGTSRDRSLTLSS